MAGGSSSSVSSILQQLPALTELDEDMHAYLSSLLEETVEDTLKENGNNVEALTMETLQDAIAPFLESSGFDDPEQMRTICTGIHSGIVALYKKQSEDSTCSSGAGAAEKKLSKPVRLGDNSHHSESEMVNIMWGRDKNKYVNANKEVGFSEKEKMRDQKRQEKNAKKEEADRVADLRRAGLEADGTSTSDAAVTTSDDVVREETNGKQSKTIGNGDIHLQNISLGFDGSPLIDNAELRLVRGRRYGLVGRNGMGKSTLLKAMARLELQGIPKSARVMAVQQEIEGSDKTALEAVIDADVTRRRLIEEERNVLDEMEGTETEDHRRSLQEKMENITSQLEAIDAFGAESRAGAILSGLRFTQKMQSTPTRELSGGWRMRVALACALFVSPDVLALDEPTNHLDFPSVRWLENQLQQYPADRILFVVSHDREFLNSVSTDIIHLHRRKLLQYRGNYDTFENTRAERAKHAARAQEKVELQKQHMQSFIDKFRYNAKRASLVQSRIKAVERMERDNEGDKEVLADTTDGKGSVVKFTFPDPGDLAPPIVQVSDVKFSYHKSASKPLLRDVDFNIDMKSRVGILGPNGVGKTTFLKLILGDLEPQGGYINRNGKLRVAYFTQHHVAQLDMRMSPLTFIQSQFSDAKEDVARSHLGRFGLAGDLALQPIGTLSGGQKSRVAFAMISWRAPHLLVLDEPTNHLDLETIDGLIVALSEFKGPVIIVSHDRHFIKSVVDEIWVVGDPHEGYVTKFRGELEDYLKVAKAEDFKLHSK